ncbi:MAG: glycosyltransferase family 4 protein [Bradymonadia bacterium]
MRILCLTTSFPTSRQPWRGVFVRGWAQFMESQGATVRIVGPALPRVDTEMAYQGYRHFGDLLSGTGAPEFLEKHPVKGALFGVGTCLSMAQQLRRNVQWAEHIVAHWLVPCALIAIATSGWRRTIPISCYAHGSDVALLESFPPSIGRRLARQIDSRCKVIIFVSEDLRSRFSSLLKRRPRSKHHVIPMGIHRPTPDSDFNNWVKHHSNGKKVVTTIGRHVPIKGLDVLLRALSGNDKVCWIAAGDGPVRARLIQDAKRYNVNLVAPGEITPSQREALLLQTDVFVQPSRRLERRQEGHPLSLSEALAAGVPSIVTQTGGLERIAETAGCKLVPCDDHQALAHSIDALLSDQAERTALRAQHLDYGARMSWAQLGHEHYSALC